ncbi:hypothetical protein M8320_13420 [Leclercia sp. H6W5]|uniref:hypothetical protein n=1 Tax=Leclercia tamurae TaxID=2926467 RepID=UPI0021D1B40F|nr:hypothetical protein [Leclercia tamurae]MCU6682996.1 hypothetical protein [Leclercia tamurae]
MNIQLHKRLSRKFIIAILTSSSFVTACTFSVIWFYLANIERLDILYDALSVSSAIGIIFGFTLISLLGFSLVIFISSFIVYLIYTAHEKEFRNYDGLTHSFTTVCMCNSFVMCFVLISAFCLQFFWDINGFIVFALATCIITAFSYGLCHKLIFSVQSYIDKDNERTEKYLQKKSVKRFLPALLIIPAFTQIFPLFFIAGQLDFIEENNSLVQAAIFILLSMVLIIVGIFPGVIIINEKKNKNILQIITYALIIIPVSLLVLTMIFRPTPNMIINMSMSLSGISDWRTHQYYISIENHPPAMFDGALWNTHFYKDISSRFFITGVSIFSLGNIKLVCPTSINNVRSASLKTTADDFDEYNIRIKKLKKTAMTCVPFDKKEIHLWDSPISEPIYYQKVKSTGNSKILNLLHELK